MDDPDSELVITGRIDLPWKAPFVDEEAFLVPDEPLARGGMALIYEAADRRLPRRVILKRPRTDEDLPDHERRAFVDRLEAEALVLARLQHPSIVTLYELGRAGGGTPFCVLQRVEGRSLRARLDELADAEADGPPRTADRLELVAGIVGIAEALAYAHERGIVHRDVTPNNVLLGARGEMTLIDWGLAKDTTRPGAAEPVLEPTAAASDGATISAGTPPYVCFEQTQGRPADPSYDVYSLGVTLYEIVAGRPPYRFELPRDPEARDQAIHGFLAWAESGPEPEPAAPRDPELSGIIARAMARDADARFSADELVTALKQYLTGELVFSHRYSRTGRLARWVRRHRTATVSAAIAAIALVAAGQVWATSRAADAERAQERARDEALVLAQKVEAAEARERAQDAEQRAQAAEEAAAQARLAGRESRALQEEADRLRQEAEAQATRARKAADDAAGQASEAQARWQEAVAARADADAARAEALKARDAADAARAIAEGARARAESERDAARDAAARADAARDAAEDARTAAERQRDDAIEARAAAVAARDAAEAARTAAERARDDALAQVRALEARIAELEARADDPPPADPPAPDPAP